MRQLSTTLLLLMLAASCAKNPFSTRESEEPTTRAGTFIPPTTPQIVLENLRLSYGELVIGNFIQCLDSDFVFTFDFIQGAQTDSGWGFVAEVNLTENLFNSFSVNRGSRSMKVELSPQADQPDVILDSTATLVRGYVVTVADSAGKVIDTYQGVARFELVEGAFNFWAILLWKDLHLNLEKRSWAELKNAFR